MDPVEPYGGGFLVVITKTTGPVEISPGEGWHFRVRELSGHLFPDTTFLMFPVDTTILRVPIATYFVDMWGVPTACELLSDNLQQAFVPEAGTTVTLRYNVECRSLLTLRVVTLGQEQDDAYVYRVTAQDGTERTGTLAASDTVRFDEIEAGSYEVRLAHVAPNCVITTGGGRLRKVTVSPPKLTDVPFTVVCSDPRYRPAITHIGNSFQDGLSVFFFEAFDPGSPNAATAPDIAGYSWDITDCEQNTLLKAGPVILTGLNRTGSRNQGKDTVRVVMVLNSGLNEGQAANGCFALRVWDTDGNTTDVVEVPMNRPTGKPPLISEFRAALTGGTTGDPRVQFTLAASDPDGDLAGSYVQILLRDGKVLSRGLEGYLGTVIPDLRLNSVGLTPETLAGVRVFAVDRQGNFAQADFSFLN